MPPGICPVGAAPIQGCVPEALAVAAVSAQILDNAPSGRFLLQVHDEESIPVRRIREDARVDMILAEGGLIAGECLRSGLVLAASDLLDMPVSCSSTNRAIGATGRYRSSRKHIDVNRRINPLDLPAHGGSGGTVGLQLLPRFCDRAHMIAQRSSKNV